MKKENFEDYEQMNVSTNEAPKPAFFSSGKKGSLDKKKLFLFLLIFLVICFCIYFLVKSSQLSLLKEQNEQMKNDLDSLTRKEQELKNKYNSLLSEKESLTKENDNLSKDIKKISDENEKSSNKNKETDKTVSELQEKAKSYEKKIEESKSTIDELTKKEKKLKETLDKYNTEISNLEKIISEAEQKEKEKKDEEKDKEKEEKKEENKDDDEEKSDKDKDDSGSGPNINTRIDSKIIIDPKYLDVIDEWFSSKLKYKLLYRASEEEYSAKMFHSKVDEFKNTLILIKDNRNFIYGGFTTKTWDGKKVYKEDTSAIVFNLDNEKYYEPKKSKRAIFCDPDSLAIFGEGDISLGTKSVSSNFPNTYGSSENKRNELTLGYSSLSPLEIEVFQLSK